MLNTHYLIALRVEDKIQQSYINAIKEQNKNEVIDNGKYMKGTGPKGGDYKRRKLDDERYETKSGINAIKGDGEFDTHNLSVVSMESN